MLRRKAVLTAVAAGLALGAAAGAANATAISSMTITSGTFYMAGVTPSAVPFSHIGANTNLVGGYIGAGVDSPTFDATSPVGFSFFGAPVNTYTAASNQGAAGNPPGSIPGGPVPTGDITGGVMTMDLSSFFANWNGTDFNQGSPAAMGTASCVGSSCNYTLSWNSLIVGGPFNGFTGSWVLNGVATVPIPAAVWLFGSGLLGLVGIARRRRELA